MEELTEQEKMERYKNYLAIRNGFVNHATAVGFTEDQAIFLFEHFLPLENHLKVVE